MAFVKIKPKRLRSTSNNEDTLNKVKVSFPYVWNSSKDKIIANTVLVYIGKNIAKKLSLKGADRVSISYDNKNPRMWFIEKTTDNDGYKLLDIKNKKGQELSPSLRLQLHRWNWELFKPEHKEIAIREVKHDFFREGIRLYLDKS